MSRLIRWIVPMVLVALLAGGQTGGLRATEAEPIYLALLVGSQAYQGTLGLPDLEYTDDDVLRFAHTIRPLVHPTHIRLLVSPDPAVAAGLDHLRLMDRQTPTRAHLQEGLMWLASQLRELRAQFGPQAELRVLIYLSAHGDALGIHLDDGIVTGQLLQAYLDDLEADSVLVIADACFSAQWLALKGESDGTKGAEGTPPISEGFPMNALANAVRNLERVGAVTSQSVTREERTLVRGGMVTHVVSSALAGAADLDQDRRISYEELATFLRVYSARDGLLRHVTVHPPRRSAEEPPVLVDLNAMGTTGLRFPAKASGGPECFWILDEGERLVSEVCKPAGEQRQISLPEGHYRVQHFNTASDWIGREGEVAVTVGFAPIGDDQLDGWWVWPGGKGGEAQAAIPPGARPISDAEASYRAMSPIVEPVSWRDLPAHRRTVFRIGWAGLGTVGRPTQSIPASLTHEKPFYQLGATFTQRLTPLGRGYLIAGGDLTLGASPDNAVGYAIQATVLRAQYHGRLGLERRVHRNQLEAVLRLGGFSALPVGGDGEEIAALAAYRLALGGSGGLELSLTRPMPGGIHLQLGGTFDLSLEPQAIGPDQRRLEPYSSLGVFTGVRW